MNLEPSLLKDSKPPVRFNVRGPGSLYEGLSLTKSAAAAAQLAQPYLGSTLCSSRLKYIQLGVRQNPNLCLQLVPSLFRVLPAGWQLLSLLIKMSGHL